MNQCVTLDHISKSHGLHGVEDSVVPKLVFVVYCTTSSRCVITQDLFEDYNSHNSMLPSAGIETQADAYERFMRGDKNTNQSSKEYKHLKTKLLINYTTYTGPLVHVGVLYTHISAGTNCTDATNKKMIK